MNSTAGIPIKLLYEAESMKITVEVSYDLRLLYVNNSLKSYINNFGKKWWAKQQSAEMQMLRN